MQSNIFPAIVCARFLCWRVNGKSLVGFVTVTAPRPPAPEDGARQTRQAFATPPPPPYRSRQRDQIGVGFRLSISLTAGNSHWHSRAGGRRDRDRRLVRQRSVSGRRRGSPAGRCGTAPDRASEPRFREGVAQYDIARSGAKLAGDRRDLGSRFGAVADLPAIDNRRARAAEMTPPLRRLAGRKSRSR